MRTPSGTDVGQFVATMLDFLDTHSEMKPLKGKFFGFVLTRLHANSAESGAVIRFQTPALLAEYGPHEVKEIGATPKSDWEELGDVLTKMVDTYPLMDEAKVWEWAINRIYPPSHAHGRTMLGGLGEVMAEFKKGYSATMKMIQELPPEEQKPIQQGEVPRMDTSLPAGGKTGRGRR